MPLSAHIRYPYFTHPILRRNPRDAYTTILDFLTSCTDWRGRWADGKISVAPTGGGFLPKAWSAQPIKQLLTRRLGKGHVGGTTNALDTLESESNHDWNIPARLHDWAIDLALSQRKVRRGYPDPVVYSASANFRLRVPPRGGILPGQAAAQKPGWIIRSSLHLSMSSGNAAASFDLAFPFTEPDTDFLVYVAAIRPYLPIRLSILNFKLLMLNKSGTDFRVRRIHPDLLTGI